MKKNLTILLTVVSLSIYSQNNSLTPENNHTLNVYSGLGHIMGEFGFAFQATTELFSNKRFSYEINIQTISTSEGDQNFYQEIEVPENIPNTYNTDFEYEETSFITFGLNVLYNPINNKRHKLGIGLGLSYNIQNQTNGYRTKFSQNDYDTVYIVRSNRNGFAPNIVLNYRYNINNKINIGLKYYNVLFDDASESIMLGFGVNF